MKKNRLITLSLCAAFSFTALSLNTIRAEEKEAEQTAMKIPDTAEGILAEIHKHHAALAETVKNNKLADVHKEAFAVRDLAKALPDKAPADKKQRIQGAVNNIAKLAEELDKSGDANDKAKTEANLKKFDAVIAQLDGQFKS